MALTNTQYDALMRTYQEKQLRRQHIIAERKNKLAEEMPELMEIDGQVASLSVQKARQLLSGDESGMQDIRARIRLLADKRAQLLAEGNYPADFLNPPYECPDCQDSGYIGNQRCHCFRQASIDLIYRQSNLDQILKAENFSTFRMDFYPDDVVDKNSGLTARQAAAKAVTICQDFVKNFDDPAHFDNLLLYGDTGVGKTFLSHCVAHDLLETGHSVIYFSAHQMFDRLADKAFHRNEDAAIDYDAIYQCDLLIIDDLGTEMANAFTTSEFFVCLNDRIRNRKSTLISSNLNLQEIANIYSERVFSRIYNDYNMLHLFGRDIRIQKKLRKSL